MAISWTEDLSVDVSEIDEQHKELFRRVNALLEACNQGKGKEEVGGVLEFLDAYVRSHFGSEEKLMLEYEYPEYINHRSQHLAFIEDVDKLRQELKERGAGLHLVVRTNQAVVDWLLRHIRKIDKAMGNYVKTKRQ